MPKYLLEGSYSAEGDRGLIKGGGGTARHKAVSAAIASGGGKLESFYWTLASNFVLILDAPNNVAVAALLMQVESTGAVNRLEATPLLAAEDIDAAVKLHPSYTPPGK